MLRNRRNTHKQMQTHTEAMAEIDMRQKKCTMCFQAEVMADLCVCFVCYSCKLRSYNFFPYSH